MFLISRGRVQGGTFIYRRQLLFLSNVYTYTRRVLFAQSEMNTVVVKRSLPSRVRSETRKTERQFDKYREYYDRSRYFSIVFRREYCHRRDYY